MTIRCLLTLLPLLPTVLLADNLYIAEDGKNRIGEYAADTGAVMNASLITGLYAPRDIKFVGNSNLLVTTAGEGVVVPSAVGLYKTSGAAVSATLTYLTYNSSQGYFYWASTLVGTNLVTTVVNLAALYSFGVNGTTVTSTNMTFISAYTKYAEPIVTDGSYYYVNDSVFGYLQKYSLTGAAVNQRLVSGYADGNTMAIDGTNIYIAYYTSNCVARVSTTGQGLNYHLINSQAPWGIACDGHGHVFVGNRSAGTVSEYSTDGTLVTSNLVTGLSGVSALAVEPAPALTIKKTNNAAYVSWPNYPSFVLQTNVNLQNTNWGLDTNFSLSNGTNTAIISPVTNSLFFRLKATNGY